MVEQIKKRTILVDLDGVLNSYNGEYREDFIPPVLSGAREFLEILSEKFIVKIFTTRNCIFTVKWLIENDLEKFVADVTNVKEPAFLHLDDRALNFDGDYENTLNNIKNFKVWYK